MERRKGTSLHLPLHWTQSHSLTSHGPPAAKPWHRGASQDHSWLMVMLNGWPNLELLPFLLSTPLTSLSFFPMRSLVWGTCPWNQTTLLCLFFSASFYYRLFLPNTLKGAGAECTCEVVGTEKCDKALHHLPLGKANTLMIRKKKITERMPLQMLSSGTESSLKTEKEHWVLFLNLQSV